MEFNSKVLRDDGIWQWSIRFYADRRISVSWHLGAKKKPKKPRRDKYHHVVVVSGFYLYFCLLCAVGSKWAPKEQLHKVRRPNVYGIRADISLSMHFWSACTLDMLEVVDLMCATFIRPIQWLQRIPGRISSVAPSLTKLNDFTKPQPGSCLWLLQLRSESEFHRRIAQEFLILGLCLYCPWTSANLSIHVAVII